MRRRKATGVEAVLLAWVMPTEIRPRVPTDDRGPDNDGSSDDGSNGSSGGSGEEEITDDTAGRELTA